MAEQKKSSKTESKAKTPKKTETKSVTKKKAPAKKTTTKKVETKSSTKAKVENKSKTDKKSTPKTKKKIGELKLWKITSAVLVIVVVFLATVIGIRFFTGTLSDDSFEKDLDKKVNDLNKLNSNNSQNPTNISYSLLVIEDPECTSCNVDYFTGEIKNNLIPELIVEKTSYDSDVGKIVSNTLGLKIAPIYLFSKTVDQRADWHKLEQVLIPVNIGGNDLYLINPIIPPTKVLTQDVQINENAITLGNPDAKVTLVEFSDFECPVCGLMKASPELTKSMQDRDSTFEPTLPKVFENYIDTGLVNYVFYNFPIDKLHPNARPVHNAVLCANEQNEFKKYSDLVYEKRESWVSSDNTTPILIEFANQINLDENKFSTCLNENKYNTQIDEEIQLAMSYGVSGTPTYFINKQIVAGLVDYDSFSQIIEAELKKANQ